MPSPSSTHFAFDANLASQLACPACLGDLRLDQSLEQAHLACAACGRAYPIVDGIPVLIADRAEPKC
jgi:uncharacterized protein YbaR (Trm112 family)